MTQKRLNVLSFNEKEDILVPYCIWNGCELEVIAMENKVFNHRITLPDDLTPEAAFKEVQVLVPKCLIVVS